MTMFGQPSQSQYGTQYGFDKHHSRMPFSKYVGKMASNHRGRLNEIPIVLSIFVPWLIFSLIVSMLSFAWHRDIPETCQALCIVVGVVTGITTLHYLWRLCSSHFLFSEAEDPPTWPLFLSSTAIVALVLAVVIGNNNYHHNMQVYMDVSNMNTYVNLDPSRTKAVTHMDAGIVHFASGTTPDVSKSAGFRDKDVYCVAPITNGNSTLNTYDFWAVGKNCCSGNGETDFRCGDLAQGKDGLRWVHDDERPFFRLAVQQAQSTHKIRSVHPLFFEFVEDANVAMDQKYKDSYKYAFEAILIYFAAQLGLVVLVVYSYSRLRLFRSF